MKFPLSNNVSASDYYAVYEPNSGADTAPLLVIVPGVAGGARQFHGALKALQNQFRTVIFTTPGVEGTPVYPGVLSVDQLAEYVAEVLRKYGTPSLLIGHSMGGFVAQTVVHKYPDLVSKLVLMSTSYGRPAIQQDVMRLTRAFGHDLMKLNNIQNGRMMDVASDIRFSERFRAEYRPDVEAFQKTYEDCPLPQAALAQHMTCGAQFTSKKWAYTLSKPVFCIHGGEDWIVSHESGQKLAQELPHSQWFTVPECGHFPFVEYPEVWQKIADFWRGATVGERI